MLVPFDFPELKPFFPKVPLCPYKRSSVGFSKSGVVSVKQHPSWTKWFKKYHSTKQWCKQHPSQVVGRLVGDSPKDIIYYKYTKYTEYTKDAFNYTFALGQVPKRPIPIGAVIYATFDEWNAAQKENQHDV